jgi:hypothetical protein
LKVSVENVAGTVERLRGGYFRFQTAAGSLNGDLIRLRFKRYFSICARSFYKPGESVALATKHGKERAVSRTFSRKSGLRVVAPDEIKTDAFGTFTGEIERDGIALETAFAKARLELPFAVAGCEPLVFVDDRRGFQVFEQKTTAETNFAHAEISSLASRTNFYRASNSRRTLSSPARTLDANRI